MWIIVEFPSEGTVEAIPNDWVINEQLLVFWPKTKTDKIKSMIIKCVPPEPTSWSKCRARVLGKGKIYDTYKEAAEARHKAQYTSDFSDIDEGSKRTIRKPIRIRSSSDDCSNDERDEQEADCEVLPPYDALLQKRNHNEEINKTIAPSVSAITSLDKALEMGNNDREKNKTVLDLENASENNASKDEASLAKRKNNTEKNKTPAYLEKLDIDLEDDQSNREILIRLMKEVKKLSIKVDLVLTEVGGIMGTLSDVGDRTDKREKLYNFPITSIEELIQFNDKMKQEREFYDKMVEFIIVRGGKTPNDHTKRVIGVVMTNEVQNGLNWEGQKNKKSFKELELAKALTDGMLQNKCFKITEADVEKSVKGFLRHAGDRLKTEKK